MFFFIICALPALVIAPRCIFALFSIPGLFILSFSLLLFLVVLFFYEVVIFLIIFLLVVLLFVVVVVIVVVVVVVLLVLLHFLQHLSSPFASSPYTVRIYD